MEDIKTFRVGNFYICTKKVNGNVVVISGQGETYEEAIKSLESRIKKL